VEILCISKEVQKCFGKGLVFAFSRAYKSRCHRRRRPRRRRLRHRSRVGRPELQTGSSGLVIGIDTQGSASDRRVSAARPR